MLLILASTFLVSPARMISAAVPEPTGGAIATPRTAVAMAFMMCPPGVFFTLHWVDALEQGLSALDRLTLVSGVCPARAVADAGRFDVELVGEPFGRR